MQPDKTQPHRLCIALYIILDAKCMAATMLNVLCCFLFFTTFFNYRCFRKLESSPQDRWDDMLFHSSRVRYLLTGFYDSPFVTARVKLLSRMAQPYRLRFAIYKWSKPAKHA